MDIFWNHTLSLLLLLLLVITVIIISTELLALCDGYLGWGWVWRAGLVAGLWVGQAFGVLLLPGFGVSSSSPQVPGHPTSICNEGVNLLLKWWVNCISNRQVDP